MISLDIGIHLNQACRFTDKKVTVPYNSLENSVKNNQSKDHRPPRLRVAMTTTTMTTTTTITTTTTTSRSTDSDNTHEG